jgi:hypothetical protein
MDRDMDTLYDSLQILGFSIFGLPVVVGILHYCIFYKCFKNYFKNSNGITACELFVRVFCFPCCKFNKENIATV